MEDSEALRNSIGRWVKGRILGRGAQGTVFLSQLSDGRHAACKQINTEGLGEEELRGIMREITLIRALHHENVVGYLGLERDATRHRLSIFMEYAMGGSVRQLLQDGGAFSEARAARTLEQVLRGLTYLHAHGVAHRDIKGANILLSAPAARERDVWSCLSPGGAPSLEEHCASPASVVHVAKLADFGASKRIGTLGEDKSVLSGLKGTPRWMAPEVIKGQIAGTLDGWVLADVWSMGCTMVEMVTGEMPWPMFPNPMAAMYHIADGKAPPLGTYAPTPNAAFSTAAAATPRTGRVRARLRRLPPPARPDPGTTKGRRAAKKKKKVRYEKAVLKQANDARAADPAGAPSPDPPPPRDRVAAPGDRGGRPHAAASGDQLLFGSSAVRREARSSSSGPSRGAGDRRNIASAPNLNWGHGHVRHSI
ncbi:MAP kinase kinase kinase [Aureococcus anophagefferens]|nr:MAP kinase kinase kinase [Aureococcus anophagefferens]